MGCLLVDEFTLHPPTHTFVLPMSVPTPCACCASRVEAPACLTPPFTEFVESEEDMEALMGLRQMVQPTNMVLEFMTAWHDTLCNLLSRYQKLFDADNKALLIKGFNARLAVLVQACDKPEELTRLQLLEL